MKNIYNLKIKLLSKDSPYFPKNLLSLSDCPDMLFILGNEKILNNTSVSIVGTRKSSQLGDELAFNISQKLSKQNITIVSGLAKGIDSKAHRGSFNNGKTIGIIAYGFNYLQSSSDMKIVTEILNNGGTIISEYFPDTPPQAFCYLKRNRLVATISFITIVIEAPIKSGALNTAKIALAHNKKVFAIPWNINIQSGEGCNFLIQNKVTLLTNYTQILNALNIPHENILNINITKVSDSDFSNIPQEFLELYKFILSHENVTKELIYSHFSNNNISSINSKLTLMELEGLIVYNFGKYKRGHLLK